MSECITVGKRRPKGLGRIRYKAEEILEDKDFSELFETNDRFEIDEAASAALKSLLVDKAAEYADEAVRFTRKRGISRIGAAAVLVSTQKERW